MDEIQGPQPAHQLLDGVAEHPCQGWVHVLQETVLDVIDAGGR